MSKYKYGKYYVTQQQVVDYYVESWGQPVNIGELNSITGSYGYTFNSSSGVFNGTGGGGTIYPGESGRVYYAGDKSISEREYHGLNVYKTICTAEPVYKQVEVQGAYISTVIAENGIYPDNGKHTDGYWYMKLGLALMLEPKINDEIHSCEGALCMINGSLRTVDHVLTMVNGQLRNS